MNAKEITKLIVNNQSQDGEKVSIPTFIYMKLLDYLYEQSEKEKEKER